MYVLIVAVERITSAMLMVSTVVDSASILFSTATSNTAWRIKAGTEDGGSFFSGSAGVPI